MPSYTAPSSLKVGEAIAAMSPTGGAGIDEYIAATGLPSGLSIDPGTGDLVDQRHAGHGRGRHGLGHLAVTVTDTAPVVEQRHESHRGAGIDEYIVFPAVGKGDQTLSGFQYSATSDIVWRSARAIRADGDRTHGGPRRDHP